VALADAVLRAWADVEEERRAKVRAEAQLGRDVVYWGSDRSGSDWSRTSSGDDESDWEAAAEPADGAAGEAMSGSRDDEEAGAAPRAVLAGGLHACAPWVANDVDFWVDLGATARGSAGACGVCDRATTSVEDELAWALDAVALDGPEPGGDVCAEGCEREGGCGSGSEAADGSDGDAGRGGCLVCGGDVDEFGSDSDASGDATGAWPSAHDGLGDGDGGVPSDGPLRWGGAASDSAAGSVDEAAGDGVGDAADDLRNDPADDPADDGVVDGAGDDGGDGVGDVSSEGDLLDGGFCDGGWSDGSTSDGGFSGSGAWSDGGDDDFWE
jgi:hypothetical protein